MAPARWGKSLNPPKLSRPPISHPCRNYRRVSRSFFRPGLAPPPCAFPGPLRQPVMVFQVEANRNSSEYYGVLDHVG